MPPTVLQDGFYVEQSRLGMKLSVSSYLNTRDFRCPFFSESCERSVVEYLFAAAEGSTSSRWGA